MMMQRYMEDNILISIIILLSLKTIKQFCGLLINQQIWNSNNFLEEQRHSQDAIVFNTYYKPLKCLWRII
jgi:hypothetical protein